MSFFRDTDTLYIEFKEADIVATKELDDNTVLDFDGAGNIISITVEHASNRTVVHPLTVSGIAG